MEKVVFLGGSCGDTTWRNKLIPKLESVGVKYFNPVVEDWNEEAQKAEDDAIKHSDTILFLISPRTSSTYSLYELAKYTNTNRKVIFTYLDEDQDISFTTHEIRVLRKIKSDLKNYKNVLVLESIFAEGVEDEIKNFVDPPTFIQMNIFNHE